MTAFGFLLPTREIVMKQKIPNLLRSLIWQSKQKRWDLTPSGSVIACLPGRGLRL